MNKDEIKELFEKIRCAEVKMLKFDKCILEIMFDNNSVLKVKSYYDSEELEISLDDDWIGEQK